MGIDAAPDVDASIATVPGLFTFGGASDEPEQFEPSPTREPAKCRRRLLDVKPTNASRDRPSIADPLPPVDGAAPAPAPAAALQRILPVAAEPWTHGLGRIPDIAAQIRLWPEGPVCNWLLTYAVTVGTNWRRQSGQRLLLPAANWASRPIGDLQPAELIARKRLVRPYRAKPDAVGARS